ncbi:extracellular catalytic domain type 1 short-chain-length polyhydroxyalkanoate depolymerase [Thiocapsa bogorovii]|uniref:PHA depolymerase n=1 Tax=Thiocapsa roseopersicina TaxID=1058 RepID=I6Q013_THIRO|nr:PHB depolymerase family esterase [Thiocapsa bogorovii]AFJ45072.1 PHA depolymerase [Thiocapsa roseopersicina]UHD16837.1 PHB depolymerase family esterase [Thiocapsa bogorovii]
MPRVPKIDMAEVTRLTREGRLQEAMGLLRGATLDAPGSDGGRTGSAPDSDRDPSAEEHSAEHRSIPGMPEIPPALRGLLDRMKQRVGEHIPGRIARPPIAPEPAALPEGARFEEHLYSDAAGTLVYKLYIPSGYHKQPLPLVVMLHGCNQSPDDFAAGTRMNSLAEQELFLVAYPAQSLSTSATKCWSWFNPEDQQRGRGEPALIAGITREIMRDYAVDPDRVYIAGLSAGGAAASIMGATYPDLYAAIGVHSGLAYGAADDMASALAAMHQGGMPTSFADQRYRGSDGTAPLVPTIVFHGDSDSTVNPVNADQVIAASPGVAQLRESRIPGESAGGIRYTRSLYTDENGRAPLEQWILHGAGHAWSGGSPDGSYTEPRGSDASREMLRFFMQHARSAAA